MYIYPKLAEAQARARQLGLPTPESSQRKGKKLYVVYNGKVIHFGSRGMSDYLQHGDPERRKRYRARARGILNRKGKPAYLDKGSR